MSAERLLAHYERIADAPDAIPRLRRFVLDLAVRGKLVSQDPADEPVEVLLENIAIDRAGKVGSPRLKAVKNSKILNIDDALFPLPVGWVWTLLGEITISRDSERIPVSKEERAHRAKVYDYYGASGVIDKIDGYLFDKPLLLIGEDGANLINRSTPIAFMARGKYWVNNHAHVLDGVSEGFLRYIELLVNATDLTRYVTGTAQPKMNQAKMNSIPVPLPPSSEQYRIVAKVDELMALCDRLEAARTAREAMRDRLAAASLARLAAPDPESFQADARFALDALPALTARADQIKALRQSILELAVRGKLVEQRPEEGRATSINGISNAPSGPFAIPEPWTWSRLTELGKVKGGGTPSKSRDDFWNGDVPWVSPKDMKVDHIAESQMAITESAIEESAVTMIEAGSLLFVVRGMILAHSFPVAIARVPLTINQDMKALVLKCPAMAEYLLRALKGLKPLMLARVQRSSHGTCRIEGADYGDFLIPIPPLAEQHRIVAKVDALMAICDELEAALATADETRRRLLDALLADALAPALAQERAA